MRLIGVYSKNRYEWFVTDWACVLFGITSVPLYDTLGVENLSYCLNQTLITTIFASNATIKTFAKLKEVGKLRLVITYDQLDQESKAILRQHKLDWIDFWEAVKRGSDLKDLSDTVVNVGINDCYTFSYTSGTTGPPKGAMIAHRNMLGCVNTFSQH